MRVGSRGKCAPRADIAPRAEAKAKGEIRYHGHLCKMCGETLRFVSTNACVSCKATADRLRYCRINGEDRKYLEGGGNATISEQDNRDFLSALAKEKAR